MEYVNLLAPVIRAKPVVRPATVPHVEVNDPFEEDEYEGDFEAEEEGEVPRRAVLEGDLDPQRVDCFLDVSTWPRVLKSTSDVREMVMARREYFTLCTDYACRDILSALDSMTRAAGDFPIFCTSAHFVRGIRSLIKRLEMSKRLRSGVKPHQLEAFSAAVDNMEHPNWLKSVDRRAIAAVKTMMLPDGRSTGNRGQGSGEHRGRGDQRGRGGGRGGGGNRGGHSAPLN